MREIIGKNTIINGDCFVEMQNMAAESVDVVVTSIPYNINLSYNTYQDNLPYQEYLDWLGKIFGEVKRVMKSNGSFFLNVAGTCKEPFKAMDVCQVARKHFSLQNNIVWIKSITVDSTSFGHFKPVTSKRFLNHQHESIFHLTKNGDVEVDRLAVGTPYQDKSNIERWKGVKADLRCRGNVWYLPYKTVKKKKQHPAGFPVELPEYCIRLHGVRDDLVVLDPFNGAGMTLLACQKLNCIGIGVDLDLDYCYIAKNNLAPEIH